MGDRGQVCIHGIYPDEWDRDHNVCIYTHWGASDLVDDVKNAIAKKWRWCDEEYFTRIVADEVIKNHGSELGYGIGNEIHGDVWRIISIDLDFTEGCKQNIKVEDNGKLKFDGSFEEFLAGRGTPREECEDMTVSDLREMCKDKGVRGYWGMRKSELIDKCCI